MKWKFKIAVAAEHRFCDCGGKRMELKKRRLSLVVVKDHGE
jgi:hypothetical protein